MSRGHGSPRKFPPLRAFATAAAIQVFSRFGGKKPLVRKILRLILGDEAKQVFHGYKPTKHDVFISTFIKSGTNWAMQIALQISHDGKAEYQHIHQLIPWPDAPTPDMATALREPDARRRSASGHQIIKTHLNAMIVPYGEEAHYVSVLRDPKEVVVSAYHFFLGNLGIKAQVSPDEWFELCVQPGYLIEAWATHTAGFWAWRDRPNVLVMTFHELKGDLRSQVEQIAALMGVSLEEEALARVLERSSFAYMKAHDDKFSPPPFPFARSKERLIRSGKTGASGELLTSAQQALIDELAIEHLARLGSDFPYRETFEVGASPVAGA